MWIPNKGDDLRVVDDGNTSDNGLGVKLKVNVNEDVGVIIETDSICYII